MTGMRKWARGLAAMLLLCLACVASVALTQPSAIDRLQRSFENPPDDSRIMMRWWWFGPALTRSRLQREMELMKAAGIGGFEVQPVYPLALDEVTSSSRIAPFLSDQFIDSLRFTNETARRLGLRVDLTIGSGWPFGGPWLAADQAASRLRVERVKVTDANQRITVPSLAASERLIATFLARLEGTSISMAGTRDISSDIADGIVRLPAPLAGTHEVQFFIASRTGQQVKRPAVGSEGFVLDHYDRSAVDFYLKTVGDRLLQAFGNTPPTAVFCDSLEVYLSDWSPDLLAEFQKRRDYDLKPFLPALVADIGEPTQSIRYDWGRTLTELLNERFLATMRDWAKRNKTLFRMQGYGVPPMTLSGNSYLDVPEGEGSQWKVVRAARWASSASHLYGRNITTSETWTWLHSPSFRATPLDIKAEADLHFLQGINQLIGHGWPYTPDETEYPGNRFYAAAVFNEKNPWWHVMPDVARYLQRMSFLLRQGQPANEVALYLPNNDAWAGFSNGRVHMIEALREHVGADLMPAILEAGFNLDFVDDEAINSLGRVEGASLSIGTNKYKAIVLPNVEYLPLETIKKLDQFVAGGGVLIASKRAPAKAPGFRTSQDEKNQVNQIARRMFEGPIAKAYVVADEKLQLGAKLASLVPPDLTLTPNGSDIGFVRRHLDDAEVYFVANSSNETRKVTASFHVSGMEAELWNPLSGNVSGIASQKSGDRTSLLLEFEPYGSRVIVFTKRKGVPLPPAANSTGLTAIDISRQWRVSYAPSSGPVPAAQIMEQLHSWTDDESTRYFSGTATYEKTVNVSNEILRSGRETVLDFGAGKAIPPVVRRNGMRAWYEPPIRDAAEVFVNGQRAGSLWLPPYELDIKRLLKPGANQIRIVVGNTAINYLSGHKLPDYKLLNLRYGERFQPQDMENLQPLQSGVLGTVHLRTR